MVKLCPGPSDLPGAPVADAVHAGAVVAWGFREKIHGTRVVLLVDAEERAACIDMYSGG